MNSLLHGLNRTLWIAASGAAILLAACADMPWGGSHRLMLTGSEQVPPVSAPGSGTGSITVGADKSVSGSVVTSGVAGVAAHIHMAPRGQNGPVIVPLAKTTDGTWTVPANARLTDEQYAAYKAGNLYVNVHTAANKGGEVRAQITP